MQDAQAAGTKEMEMKISGLEEQLNTKRRERKREGISFAKEAILESPRNFRQKVAEIEDAQEDLSRRQEGFEAATGSLVHAAIKARNPSLQTIDKHTDLTRSMSAKVNALEDKHAVDVQWLKAQLGEEAQTAKTHVDRVERGLLCQIKDHGLAICREYETVRDPLRGLTPAHPPANALRFPTAVKLREQFTTLTTRLDSLAANNGKLVEMKIQIPLLVKRIKQLEEQKIQA